MTSDNSVFPYIWDEEMDIIIEKSWKEIKTEYSNKPSDFAYFSIGFKAAVLEFRKQELVKKQKEFNERHGKKND
jgi:hypothetical protein